MMLVDEILACMLMKILVFTRYEKVGILIPYNKLKTF